MLCWLGAQSLLAWWPSVRLLMCAPASVCVLKNWGMMFIHRNQANLQAFKSNTLKCQHSKLHIWICSIIQHNFFLCVFIIFIIFCWILNTWPWWWLCASSVSALGEAVCVNRGTWFGILNNALHPPHATYSSQKCSGLYSTSSFTRQTPKCSRDTLPRGEIILEKDKFAVLSLPENL